MTDADLIAAQYQAALTYLSASGVDLTKAQLEFATFNGETNIAVTCDGLAIPIKFESRFRAHSPGLLPVASAQPPDPDLFASVLAMFLPAP
jgi:hypothetical protein